MKIERIKTEISIRKVYVPPMLFFEGIDKERILAGSIPGKKEDPDPIPGDGDPVMPQNHFVDPITEEDYSLDVDNYN